MLKWTSIGPLSRLLLCLGTRQAVLQCFFACQHEVFLDHLHISCFRPGNTLTQILWKKIVKF
jgi:hypothetical protein